MREDILDFINESLEDENKILTIKQLGFGLKISLNDAKKYLQEYADNNQNINVTYCLIGYVSDPELSTDVLKVQLANEKEKLSLLPQFKSEPICHVYSIQKTKLDACPLLFSLDYDLCQKLSLNEVGLFNIRHEKVYMRDRKYVIKTEQPTAIPAKKSSNNKSNSSSQNDDTNSQKAETNVKKSDGSVLFFKRSDNNKSDNNKTDNNKTDNNKLNNNKNENNKTETNEIVKNEVKQKAEQKPTTKQAANKNTKSLASLFSNHAKKPKVESNSQDTSSQNSEVNEKVEVSNDKTNKRGKVTKSTRSSNTKSKKRKRIRVESSSDSDDDKNTDDDDDESIISKNGDKSDEENMSVDLFDDSPKELSKPKAQESITSAKNKRKAHSDSDDENDKDVKNPDIKQVNNHAPKNSHISGGGVQKKKVLETNTYLDDDGYMVTEKVMQSINVGDENVCKTNTNATGNDVTISTSSTTVNTTNNNSTSKNENEELKQKSSETDKQKETASENHKTTKKAQPSKKKGANQNNSKQSSIKKFFS